MAPVGRRDYLDDLLADLHPKNDAACADLAKALKQRNALLKQMSGRVTPEAELTLDVWDQRMVELGERVGSLRAKLIDQLQPLVAEAYAALALTGTAGADGSVGLTYGSVWRDTGLAAALAASRRRRRASGGVDRGPAPRRSGAR